MQSPGLGGVIVNKWYESQQHTSDLYLGFGKSSTVHDKQLVVKMHDQAYLLEQVGVVGGGWVCATEEEFAVIINLPASAAAL